MSDQDPQPVGALDDEGNWKKTVWIPEISDEAARRIERLKQDLELEKRAAADGHSNQPAQADIALNTAQLDICNRVFAGILMLNEFLAEQVGLAVKRVRPLMPAALDVEAVKEQIGSAMEAVFAERHRALVTARTTELARLRDLRFFRFENGLTRDAEYRDSVVKVFALILAMFLFESVINGSLFSEVVSDGLVGGAVLAGFISLINIVTGLVAGFYGWRYLGHRRVPLRVLGLTLMVVCHLVALFWNLLIAHFREVAETLAATNSFDFNPAVLTGATLKHLATAGLLGITSIQSLGLLFLGIFIHFFAAKEGWDELSDRYPDYKRKDLRAVLAREDYDDALAQVRDDAREAIETIEARFRQAIDQTRRCFDLTSEMLALAAQRRQEVRNSEDRWVADGNQLLKSYREINVGIRDEGTTPAYFADYPTAADYRRRTYGGSPSGEVFEQEKLVDAGIESIIALRDKSKIALDQAESALKEVQRHVVAAIRALDDQVDAESKKVTREAERELRKRETSPREALPDTADAVA